MQFTSLLALTAVSCFHVVLCQESSNQNQSDTLINKEILLPLLAGENQTFCTQWQPNGTSQWEWIFDVVYRAFTGEYRPLSDPTMYQGQGILNASAYYRDPAGHVTWVNLLKYFDGSIASSNRYGKATPVKFVHGNGTKWENERLKITWTPVFETVITHMVEHLGAVLGCNELSFPLYEGDHSMYNVHRFMNLKGVEIHYFIHNLYNSFVSTGVSQSDGIIFGTAIDNLFNKLCSPSKVIAPYQPKALQNMCLDNATCAIWAFKNRTCSAYGLAETGVEPRNVSSTGSSTKSAYEVYGGDGPNSCNGYGDFGRGGHDFPPNQDHGTSAAGWVNWGRPNRYPQNDHGGH